MPKDRGGRSEQAPGAGRRGLARRPGVEPLEGRTLLSTVSAAKAIVPAAYKPATTTNLKFPPYDIAAQVDATSDPSGSGYVFQSKITVSGTAPANSTVWMAIGLKPGFFIHVARADSTGFYKFQTAVPRGNSVLQVFSENTAQDYSSIRQVNVHNGDPIVAWDSLALRAIRNQSLAAPDAARALAILHSAQYDAVANISAPQQTYAVTLTPPKGASANAAANAAAFTALQSLFPSQSSTFTAAYKTAVAGLPSNNATQQGLAFGTKVAHEELALRANDGSTKPSTLAPSGQAGHWRPTPPTYAPAQGAQYANVKPFVLTSPSVDRPSAPPAVGSATYDQALSQVASLGRANSTTRTTDQTVAANFWNGAAGSFTDPGHWNAIADSVAISRKTSLLNQARIFAQLDFALADTAIASTDAQVAYTEWRPVSAIQQADPTFSSLLSTPASPGYVSDNAAYGAAASTVLTSAFGSNVAFTDTLYASSGVTRSYTSFAQAAAEDANSRIWGGVNFSFDTEAGTALGTKVGTTVLSAFPGSK